MIFPGMLTLLCWSVVTVGSLLLLGLTVAAGYIIYIRYPYRHLPRPKVDSFFSGHLPCIVKWSQMKRSREELYLHWVNQHGKVFCLFVYHRVIIIIADYKLTKDLLTKVRPQTPRPYTIYRSFSYLFGQRTIGNALFALVDPERWERSRTTFNPAFHRKALLNLLPQFNTAADELVMDLSQSADGKTVVNMQDVFTSTTLDIMAKVAFSYDVKSGESLEKVAKAMHTFCRGLNTIQDPLFKWRPSKAAFREKYRQDIKYLRQVGANNIAKRKAAIAKGDDVPEDLMTLALKSSTDIEDIIDNFFGFFFGGFETTANTLTFCLEEIRRHPEVLQRLTEEVDEVIGQKTYVSADDLSKLEYMGWVIQETLRLYPIVTGTFRQLADEQEILGYKLPAKTVLRFSYFAIQRLDETFPDALNFRPDRFCPRINEPSLPILSFSIGPRNCIGQHFGMMEAKVLLSKFIQRFTFQADPQHVFGLEEVLTLRSRGGAPITLTPR